MWSGGKDQNEQEERVLLLVSSSKKNINTTTAKSSIIGGCPIYFPTDSNTTITSSTSTSNKCSYCQEEMHLILQMNTPLDDFDRTMYVFGCNNASCYRLAFDNKGKKNDSDRSGTMNQFLLGGGGVIKCIRSQSSATTTKDVTDTNKNGSDKKHKNEKSQSNDNKKNMGESSWGMDNEPDDDDDDDNDWGDMGNDDDDSWGNICDSDDDDNDGNINSTDETNKNKGEISMNELEAMLKQIETKEKDEDNDSDSNFNSNMKQDKKKHHQQQQHVNSNTPSTKEEQCTSPDNSSMNKVSSFPQYSLEAYDEPSSKIQKGKEQMEEDDDDYIGLSSNKNDSAVNKLLSKYLKEEEDEYILAAIRGTEEQGVGGMNQSSSKQKGGGGGDESYERLPPEERAFLAFTDRLKRAPNQVVRYAYGGEAMWSIPLPLTLPKGKKGRQSRDLNFPQVPNCPCGSPRAFEFQLMPSVLHKLDVDRHSATSNINKTQRDGIEHIMGKDSGGMNWGVIAVYSCADSCEHYREEFVVLQESTDGSPKKVIPQSVTEEDET